VPDREAYFEVKSPRGRRRRGASRPRGISACLSMRRRCCIGATRPT